MRRRARGQGGFTLVEGVLTIAVTSLGLLAVALGLLTSVRADNSANEQQRLNLALTTFSESLQYRGCGAYASPARPPGTPAPTDETFDPPSSLAAEFLATAVQQPQLAEWIDRGYTFSVVRVEYWDPSSSDPSGTDTYVQQCPGDEQWPAVRLSISACRGSESDGDTGLCADERIVEAQVVKRTRDGVNS